MVISVILAGITFKKASNKWFVFFVILVFANELILYTTSRFSINNWPIVCVFLAIELLMVTLACTENLVTPAQRRFFRWSIPPFLILFLILWFTGCSTSIPIIQNLYLLSLVSFSLFLLYTRDRDYSLFRNPDFLMILGLLISYTFLALVNLLIEPLLSEDPDPEFANLFMVLIAVMNFITYGFFTASFTVVLINRKR